MNHPTMVTNWGVIGYILGNIFRNSLWTSESSGKLTKIPMGTDGDTLRRREKNKKSLCPHLPQREKKLDCSWVHAEPSHWLHEISLSKTVRHQFPTGLIPLVKNWDTYCIFQVSIRFSRKVQHYIGWRNNTSSLVLEVFFEL